MRNTPFGRALLLGAALLLFGAGTVYGADARRPNLLVIVADDFGHGDIGVHGCKDIPTPHIDSLARNGVRCSNGYVSAPQCAPTRCGLLTGRYQQRFGYEYNADRAGGGLPLSEVTLADRLKAAGYATGLVGKWHLGTEDKYHPLNRGFGEFFGFTGGANPYLPDPKTGAVPRILRGKAPAGEKEYLTDAFGREARSFIERHRNEPFFLYLAFNAPHAPLQATETYLKRFAHIPDEGRRTYAAMVSAMDDAIGAVLEKLQSAGLEQNTLVFFISDNGGPEEVNHSSNAPLRGVKGEVLEGGIRVPFLVQWKGRLPAGRVYDRPVIQLDILPTALAAAGAALPEGAAVDGVNLLPHLSGKTSEPPHAVLYWRFLFGRRPDMHQWAIRQGDTKLFKPRDGPPTLVNLAADPRETKDLAAQQPQKAEALEETWKQWDAKLAKPAWPRGEPGRKAGENKRRGG